MWGIWATVVVSALADSQSPSSGPPCPDPVEVEAQLARLGVEHGVRPEIAVTGDKMRVVLYRPDGETLGSRQVEAPASCHERATVAAVLVATWMGVWPEAAKPTATTPASPASPNEPRAGGDGQGFGIAMALTGAFDGNGLGMGIAAESNWRLYGPLRGWVGLSAFTERDKNIGPGRAAYTRPALEAGPSLRFGRGRVQGEIGLAGRLGLLLLRGKDLTTTYLRMRAVPGAGTWLRLMVVSKSLSPFLTAGGAYWLGRETATLDDSDATTALPRWDAHLGVGVFWGLRP
jgi:hypothetical protein